MGHFLSEIEFTVKKTMVILAERIDSNHSVPALIP